MTTTFIKKTLSRGWLAYSFRDSVLYHHDGEHGSIQADMVLELRLLHLAGSRKPSDCHNEA